MSNFCEAVEKAAFERGFQIGMERGRLTNIQNLMDSMKWSAQQAMDALMIHPAEQEKYASKLNKLNTDDAIDE